MGTPCRAFGIAKIRRQRQSQPQQARHPVDAGLKGQIVMTVLRWSLACFVAIYLLMIVGLAVFQRRLQYFPDRHLVDPAQAGMSGVEDLRLTTDDGEVLVAWYVPATDGHPLILYFHGNGGALVDRVPRFLALKASGYGLLAIFYRGYGDWPADTKGPDGGWRNRLSGSACARI
jgi:acetyl esterase/lipase